MQRSIHWEINHKMATTIISTSAAGVSYLVGV